MVSGELKVVPSKVLGSCLRATALQSSCTESLPKHGRQTAKTGLRAEGALFHGKRVR